MDGLLNNLRPSNIGGMRHIGGANRKHPLFPQRGCSYWKASAAVELLARM